MTSSWHSTDLPYLQKKSMFRSVPRRKEDTMKMMFHPINQTIQSSITGLRRRIMQIKTIICLQFSGIAMTVCRGGGSTIIIRTYSLPSHILSAVVLTPRLLSCILAILKESLQPFGIFPFNSRRIGFEAKALSFASYALSSPEK